MNTDESLALEFSTIDDLIKHGFKNLVQAIKYSNALPTGTNHDFYNTNESFNKLLLEDGGRILKLMNHILQSADIPVSVFNRTNDERVELLVDANDQVLEDVANMIDEYNGIKKKTAKVVEIETVSARLPVNGSWNQLNKVRIAVTSSSGIPQQDPQLNTPHTVSLITAKNIIRPQTFFKDKIDNSNLYPWQPRIVDKPNSVKQLSLYIENTDFGDIYSHPYETELDNFKPLDETLTKCTPVKFVDINATPLIEIYTEEGLNAMVKELREVREIAVDLEHHSYRTFMGITCLMQISIPGKDYVIDTLVLRDKLWVLNEVFTKKSIVKIFHGADSDIQWLQRDLSLYIVNMFDTHQAAILLNYPKRSLACLLTKFCNFTPNKHFQLADWRIRPLPEELKIYAREDTHYLIYIYHKMRNELIDAGKGDNHLLQAAFERSKEICLKRYIKNICTADSHLKFYRNCKRFFDNRQLFALKLLFNWRDNIAREEDESTSYVLPSHMMLQICETLPREMQGIFACCNPVPPLLRANSLEIHNFILKAREQPLEKAILKEDNRAKGSTLKFSRINVDGPLHCPHDIIKAAEFSDLPTLLNNPNNDLNFIKTNLSIERQHPVYSVFDRNRNNYESSATNVLKNLKFLGPFERYKLVKSFIQLEEDKEQEKQQVLDKTADPSVEERIAMLQKACSSAIVISENPTSKTAASFNKKQLNKQEQYQSLRQQFPSNKRKRRSSLKSESFYKPSSDELTSTLPNFNVKMTLNPKKRRKQLDDAEHSNSTDKSKRQMRRQRQKNNKDPNQVQNSNRGGNRRGRGRNQTSEGQNNSFKPYDYGSVDYSRFGRDSAESTSKQGKVTSQFRGRGQGKRNFRGRNTNKSASFFRNERK